MRALIDADILPYEFGSMVQLEDPTEPLPWEIVRSMVDDRINQIIEATSSDSYSLYLTDSKSNFRMELATILPYKGNRKTEKPHHWSAIRQHLIDNWDAEVQYGIEADDRLGIAQMKDMDVSETKMNCETVICSRDKDLHMIPGWHYVWPAGQQKEKLWFQDETSAIRCFYRQLLTGDRSTDNILGLFGVGSSSQLVKNVENADEERVMFGIVYKAYQDRFGSYAKKFLYENAALLWMMREEPHERENPADVFYYGMGKIEQYPQHEIYNRLDNLMSELEDE